MPLGHQISLNGEESVSLVSSGLNPGVLKKIGEARAEMRALWVTGCF